MMSEKADLNKVLQRISERIRHRRKTLGLTQEALAERAGLSANFLAQLEICVKTPSLKTLVSLATALEIDLSDLVESSSPSQWNNEDSNLLRSLHEMKESDARFALDQLRTTIDHLKWGRDG